MKFTLLEKFILNERYLLCEDATELATVKTNFEKLKQQYETAVADIKKQQPITIIGDWQATYNFFETEVKEIGQSDKALNTPEKLWDNIDTIAKDTANAYYTKGWMVRYGKKTIANNTFNKILQSINLLAEFSKAETALKKNQNWDTFKKFILTIRNIKNELAKYKDLKDIDNKALSDAKQSIIEVENIFNRTDKVLALKTAETDTELLAAAQKAITDIETNKNDENKTTMETIDEAIKKILPDFATPKDAHNTTIPDDTKKFIQENNKIIEAFKSLSVADEEDTSTDWAAKFKKAAKVDATTSIKPGEKSKVGQLWDEYFKDYLLKQNSSLDINFLYDISDPLIKEINAYGFTTTTNPFLVYLSKHADIIKTNPEIYYTIHDSFVDNKLNRADLEEKGVLKDENLIFKSIFFNLSHTDAKTYLGLQSKAIQMLNTYPLESSVEGEDPDSMYKNKPIQFFKDLFYVGGNVLDSKINKPNVDKLKSSAAVLDMLTKVFGNQAIQSYAYDETEKNNKVLKITATNYKKAANNLVNEVYKANGTDFLKNMATIISAIASAQTDGGGEAYITSIHKWPGAKKFTGKDRDTHIKYIDSPTDRKQVFETNKIAKNYDFSTIIAGGANNKNVCDAFIQEVLALCAAKK